MLTSARKRVALAGLGGAAALVVLGAWFSTQAADSQPTMLQSAVVSAEAAQPLRGDWGEMRKYFTGETGGIKDVLVATAVLKPGKAIHRVHRHAEEEFVLVTEGSGTWHLAGKEFAAKRGDVLYAAPWVDHGITNSSTEPMVWFVVRFAGKGVPAPPPPKQPAGG